MTKEKSKPPKLIKEADKTDLKPLKKIKKHKPPKPLLTPDSDSIQSTKKKKKNKEKHKSDEPTSLNPQKLDAEVPDSDSVTKKKKKKKHELADERVNVEAPDSDSVQSLKKKKKKKHNLGKAQKTRSLILENIDSIACDSDPIQTTKKKKYKLDKPQLINTEQHNSTADSVQSLKKKKNKLKYSETNSPNPEKVDFNTNDSDLTHALEKKKKKQKKDKPQKPQSPEPEKNVCEVNADSIRTPKKKKPKLDKSNSLNPETLDSNINAVSNQTRKGKRKHELDEPKASKLEKLDSEIPKNKKGKLDECQIPQSVNNEIIDSEIDTVSIQNLLEPHTKDQLIEFLLDSAVKTPSILSKIIETANQDISHRKIFVHNLDWDTTRESVASVFEQFGELEGCDVVYDRVTGKTKGFGFVIFKSRECAKNALKEPKKRIDNRIVSCQLASVGPPVVGGVDNSSRKIYVSNVEKDVDSGKLRQFFEKFGEIEAGPLGFDVRTGKSKGYALFVYKTLEGARKVLEEPNKIFDGKQLTCRMANDWNGRKKISKSDSSVTTVMMPVPHDLSAVLPKQNMAMVGQQAGLNPMSGQLGFNSISDGLYANASAGLLNQLLSQAPEGLYANPSAGLLNQLLSQAAEGLYANPSANLVNQLLSQSGIGANQFGQIGVGLGGYGEAISGQGMGGSAWNQSVLGSCSGFNSAPVLQDWQHAYPGR